MVEITDKEYALFKKLTKAASHFSPENCPNTYFICGQSTDKNEHGMPDILLVCPAYGLDFEYEYRRVK